jgi:hypothetical protein
MKPSTITPSGKRHSRGFIVTTHDRITGRTYHSESYIKTHINVYPETAPGLYSDEARQYSREQLQITGYIN